MTVRSPRAERRIRIALSISIAWGATAALHDARAHAQATEAAPAEAAPAEAMPVEAMPVEAMAVEAMPVEAMPVDAMGAIATTDASVGATVVVPPGGEQASARVVLDWDERWGRSGIPNYVLIGGGAVAAGVLLAIGSQGGVEPTRGGWLFDEEARDALRLPQEGARLIARDVSDVLLTVMTSAPLILDAFILAAWQHARPDIAFEIVLMHAEVAAVTATLQIGANVLVRRERPYGRTCGGGGPDDLPAESFMCDSPDRTYSFFSGHTSQAFAGAAMVCSAHLNLPLLGGGDIELLPCLTGMGLAATTAMMRVLGDQHYITDVVTGAVIGTGVGFLLPWLLHFRHRDNGDAAAEEVAPEASEGERDEPVASSRGAMITVLPAAQGASIFGVF
jgi:membrane-associated phospholipid phosphatase